MEISKTFWVNKRIFLTGHTGFKGSWLVLWLQSLGAKVYGLSLEPPTIPNLFNIAQVSKSMACHTIGDIRNLEIVHQAMKTADPEIVIHMAAQPLVRFSYQEPVQTFATNLMGTVHVLEAVRRLPSIKVVLVVTTDKCYENKEWPWSYRENEPMGGHDPYSSSKGCAELVTSAYRQSFFSSPNSVNKIASARAGNVIGGGDWSQDRLIPDAIKAFEASKPLMIRNPLAMRPWQHVLEPLSGYLILAQALFEQGSSFASAWNFGPNDRDNRSVQEVVELMISGWGESARWEKEGSEQPHEANLLKLDCSKAQTQLGWVPRWNLEIATQNIVQWQKAYQAKKSMHKFSLAQIDNYMSHKL